MKKYLIPFALSILLSCAEKEVEPIPDHIYSIEKMTAIMMDMQIIEGGIVIRQYNKTQHHERISKVYRAMYNKHGITKDELDLSMRYYTDNPDKLEEVYDRVLERLSELDAKVANEKPDPPQTGD